MLYNQHPYSGNQKRKQGKPTKAEELQFSEIQTLYPLDNNSSLPPRLSPWQPSFYFLSTNLTALGISCKWNFTYLFIWLASLGIMSSRFIHIVASVKISLLLKAELYFIVHMKPHLFSIHFLMAA